MINFSNNKIEKVFHGNDAIGSVFYGHNLVWSVKKPEPEFSFSYSCETNQNTLTITSSVPQTIKFFVDDSTESQDFQLEANVERWITIDIGENEHHNVKVVCEDETALTKLYCEYDSLTEFDVSKLTNLEYLGCSYNSLTSLDVSNLTNLVDLGCGYNNLTSMDVSGLTYLELLECSSNQLTELNVSNCPNLINVFARENNPIPIPNIIGNDGHIEIVYS